MARTLPGIYLATPMQMLPGKRMVININDPQQRAGTIAYLAMLK